MYHGIRVCYYFVYSYIIIILLYIHTSRVVGGGFRTVFNALSHCHSSTCPAAAGAVTHRCCSSREQLGIFTCIINYVPQIISVRDISNYYYFMFIFFSTRRNYEVLTRLLNDRLWSDSQTTRTDDDDDDDESTVLQGPRPIRYYGRASLAHQSRSVILYYI